MPAVGVLGPHMRTPTPKPCQSWPDINHTGRYRATCQPPCCSAGRSDNRAALPPATPLPCQAGPPAWYLPHLAGAVPPH